MDVTRTTVEAPAGLPAAARQVVADYVSLTKPKVQSLLLLTTVTTMLVAGRPSVGLILLTCLGGYLSAGGAGAVNHWYDRDVDARMKRTADRPVASGRVAPTAALVYGCVLSALSFVLLAATVNLLAATLALSGFVGYTLLYTVWLKRRTWQNIVWGGAAGAVPPLVGWAAATGHVGIAALLLFAIVFIWTPPHFWALALLIKDKYADAGVPMLPVVRGERTTARQIVLYSLGLVADAAAVGLGRRGSGLCRLRARSGSGLRLARRAAAARHDAAAGDAPLPLLAPLPRAALRGARS